MRFRRPDGTVLAEQVQAPVTDHRAVVAANDQVGLTIDHATAVPSWAGEHLDLGLCIESLLGGDEQRNDPIRSSISADSPINHEARSRPGRSPE